MQTLRNFLIAFGVGLIVFGILAYMLLSSIGFFGQPAGKKVDMPSFGKPSTEQTDAAEPSRVRSANGFTLLLGGFDDKGELELLMLFDADAVNERFMLSSIPTALRVRVKQEDGTTVFTTLRELPTRFEGPDCKQMILKTVTQITGLETDYYLFMDRANALEFFNRTNGLYFDVPETLVDIGTGTVEDPEVNIEKGGQVLGRQRIVQLLTFDKFGLGDIGNSVRRARIQADFIDQTLLQFDNFEPTTLNRIASATLGECDTDITYEDYSFYFELLERYAECRANNRRVYWDGSDPIEEVYTTAMFAEYADRSDAE